MTDKPNIVFIMPDQLRHDFLSCYGASFIDTPNIDALCEQGIRYQNAYSEHPVCVPARASLLTGMNAVKTGVLDNGQYVRPDYQACGIQTWPELLAAEGYTTVATGKMHFYPWEKRFGFQERIIAEDKLWGFIEDDYFHFLHEAGNRKTSFVDVPEYHQHHQACVSPLPWEYSVDHYVGRETERWIENYGGEDPFAMMVGFPGPHSPYDPAKEYAVFDPADMPEPIEGDSDDTEMMSSVRQHPRSAGSAGSARSAGSRKSWYAVKNGQPPTRDTHLYQRACYAGLIAQIDLEVGRIVSALESKGILDNTVIIFSSDHGDYLGDHGLRGKGSFYEGACHVPMIVRHPRLDRSASSDDLVTLTDVTATMIGLAGRGVPSYVDSRPLPGLGLPGENPRPYVFGALRNGWMMYDGVWKLAKYPGGTHLFNLQEDPAEQKNRSADPDCADVFGRLDTALTSEFMRSLNEANFAGRIPSSGNSSSVEFGKPGWERIYPNRWQDVYPE
jgi:arylsulfatase